MRAGALDRRVTLRRATVTVNGYGEEIPTWDDLATVWASKDDVRDAERVQAAAVGAIVTTRFQIRWSATTAGLTNKDQLICEGRLYQVVALKEISRREGIEITATAQADS